MSSQGSSKRGSQAPSERASSVARSTRSTRSSSRQPTQQDVLPVVEGLDNPSPPPANVVDEGDEPEVDDLEEGSLQFESSATGRGASSHRTLAGLSTSARPTSPHSTSTKSESTRRLRIRADLGQSSEPARDNLVAINNAQAMETDRGIEDGGRQIYVWGTTVSITHVQQAFRAFLTRFTTDTLDDDERLPEGDARMSDEPMYIQRFAEMSLTQDWQLPVNLGHVRTFDDVLYKRIVSYPADVIPYLDLVASELYGEHHPSTDDVDVHVEVRPFNADITRNMRSLDPNDINSFITVTGMVTRTSTLMPEVHVGFFECRICKHTVTVEVAHSRIDEPTTCEKCQQSRTFSLVHNRCVFGNQQMVKLQESPDDMPAGQTPHTITVVSYGSLVDSVQPGDRVTVSGIYRAKGMRTNPIQSRLRAVFKTTIDVVHFRKIDKNRLHQDDDGTFMPSERIEAIKKESQRPDIADRLARALAPSIYGHADIKKGLLCLILGGTREATGKLRAEINVLLCGDPGTSKSQLLQYVHTLMPRGQYTSGKGSSAVGLTVSVTRDTDTRQFVLQPGALVLSDNGVCCIDEFDKMSDETRSVLHEVMEQQTLSVAKAGIICQLNARTSILAAANPVGSKWQRNKTIIENLQLPHTLLSRFDLIYLIIDAHDETYDRHLATHLVKLYHKTQQTAKEDDDVYDSAFLRDYIEYARTHVRARLSPEAKDSLAERYIKMRQQGAKRGQVSAFPRQLESLIRLSEACAKLRLSENVTVDDVDEAYRLYCEALKQSATDPDTGCVDINILASGMSNNARKHIEELADVIKRRLGEKTFGTSIVASKLLMELRQNSDRSILYEVYEEAINHLCKEDVVTRVGAKIRLIKPLDRQHGGGAAASQQRQPLAGLAGAN